MKQKIVIWVSMNHDKCRSKALKVAVGISGVEKAALTGQDKDHVEVEGDGIDSVKLTHRLRKNVAHAVLVSVSEVKKPEPTPAPPPAPPTQPPVVNVVPLPPPPCYGYPPCHFYEVVDSGTSCTIL